MALARANGSFARDTSCTSACIEIRSEDVAAAPTPARTGAPYRVGPAGAPNAIASPPAQAIAANAATAGRGREGEHAAERAPHDGEHARRDPHVVTKECHWHPRAALSALPREPGEDPRAQRQRRFSSRRGPRQTGRGRLRAPRRPCGGH